MNSAPSFFRALGDDTRWRIVRLVADRALCVCELADILGALIAIPLFKITRKPQTVS